ncbi:MAG: hypothetical protein WA949_17140 [Phormidesmis sp.]
MNINVKTKQSYFTITQLCCVFVVIALGATNYAIFKLTGMNWKLFDVGHEQSVPTYFSALNLLLSAVLLWVIYRYETLNRHKWRKYWLHLSALFFFLSMDEAISIHEKLGKIPNILTRMGISVFEIERHKWLPFGIALVVIVTVYLIPFLRVLPRDTLFLFLASGLVFLTGAIGFEYLGSFMEKNDIVDSRTDTLYLIRLLFEEGFEMCGVVLFNCVLYREIVKRKISLSISML